MGRYDQKFLQDVRAGALANRDRSRKIWTWSKFDFE